MQFNELVNKEIDYYIRECHFTKDELIVFKALCDDDTRIKICLDNGYDPKKVTNLKKRIILKMRKVIQ